MLRKKNYNLLKKVTILKLTFSWQRLNTGAWRAVSFKANPLPLSKTGKQAD